MNTNENICYVCLLSAVVYVYEYLAPLPPKPLGKHQPLSTVIVHSFAL